MVKAKIICTIGPSCDNETVLRKMMLFGMDVARLNFSHGDSLTHQKTVNLVRQLNKTYRRHIKILQDLEGYRIRIGKFKNVKTIELKRKQNILLTNKDVLGEKNLIPFDYENDLTDIRPGQFIYIDDGNIALVVKSSRKRYLSAEVAIPGILKENKGVNIPDARLKFKGLTQKDRFDLGFGIKNKVDFIAQSFVRDRDDVVCIRNLINRQLPVCKIIAKIENRQGINNIDEIIEFSDGIMIARGDMGVSIPIYEIPIVQKMIIKKCNKAKKPVITVL